MGVGLAVGVGLALGDGTPPLPVGSGVGSGVGMGTEVAVEGDGLGVAVSLDSGLPEGAADGLEVSAGSAGGLFGTAGADAIVSARVVTTTPTPTAASPARRPGGTGRDGRDGMSPVCVGRWGASNPG